MSLNITNLILAPVMSADRPKLLLSVVIPSITDWKILCKEKKRFVKLVFSNSYALQVILDEG
jgi:hypothetical protein